MERIRTIGEAVKAGTMVSMAITVGEHSHRWVPRIDDEASAGEHDGVVCGAMR